MKYTIFIFALVFIALTPTKLFAQNIGLYETNTNNTWLYDLLHKNNQSYNIFDLKHEHDYQKISRIIICGECTAPSDTEHVYNIYNASIENNIPIVGHLPCMLQYWDIKMTPSAGPKLEPNSYRSIMIDPASALGRIIEDIVDYTDNGWMLIKAPNQQECGISFSYKNAPLLISSGYKIIGFTPTGNVEIIEDDYGTTHFLGYSCPYHAHDKFSVILMTILESFLN